MDIGRLNNLLNILGWNKRVEKPEKPSGEPEKTKEVQGSSGPVQQNGDSVSISLEGIIKKTAMEVKDEAMTVREEKVSELKEKISSGTYEVKPEDIAQAILKGRDIFEELK